MLEASTSILELDFSKYKCSRESKHFQQALNKENHNDQNPSHAEITPEPQANKNTLQKTKKPKKDTNLRFISGNPSRVRLQEELISALTSSKKKGSKKRRRRKRTEPVVEKLVDSAKGVQEIQQLDQVYPFSDCCKAGFSNKQGDLLILEKYYLNNIMDHSSADEPQGYWNFAGSVPDDMQLDDIFLLHGDGSYVMKDEDVVMSSQPQDHVICIPSSNGENDKNDDSVIIENVQLNQPDVILIPDSEGEEQILVDDSEMSDKEQELPPQTVCLISDSEKEDVISDIEQSDQEEEQVLLDHEPSTPPRPSASVIVPASPWGEQACALPAKSQYESYTTAQLRLLIRQYGFKPLKTRTQMIRLLDSCHDNRNNDSTNQPNIITTNTATATATIPRDTDLNEMIYKRLDTKIKQHDELYQQIIIYEPIDIGALHGMVTRDFAMPGVDLELTKSYCDSRGICFTETND